MARGNGETIAHFKVDEPFEHTKQGPRGGWLDINRRTNVASVRHGGKRYELELATVCRLIIHRCVKLERQAAGKPTPGPRGRRR